jgi:rRNA-processing protein FCF1
MEKLNEAVNDLKALIDNGPDWASERAKIALDLFEQVKTGSISQSEYDELLEDLVRTDKLDELADDLNTKNNLVATVMVLKNFASLI